MSTQNRWLFAKHNRRGAINTFLSNHPILDIRGGGDRTFENAKLENASQSGPQGVIAYAAAWTMPDEWITVLVDFLLQAQFKVNDPSINWDFAHYDSDEFTFDQALADTTKKGEELFVIEGDIIVGEVSTFSKFFSDLGTGLWLWLRNWIIS